MNSALELERQPQLQGYVNSSPPPTPTTQTTIKLDNAEPRTVAAIMEILTRARRRLNLKRSNEVLTLTIDD